MKCRDRFVVIWFSLLFVISWAVSLARLFQIQFWDKKYALSMMKETPSGPEGLGQGLREISKSYFTAKRYVWFLPHVLGAIFWWNLYFFQLIPKIRHNYKKFHRMLGRFLMVVLLVQNITGFGLAATSHSNIIKLVSYVLCTASLFCVGQAWRYAFWRDIPKHKHWAMRLVGYMQTIALQRFWLLIFIISHASGWEGLYPQLDDDASDEEWAHLVEKMFDDSFVLCILTAILTTEWYLAAEQGLTEAPINNRNKQGEAIVQNDDDNSEKETEEIDSKLESALNEDVAS